MATETRDGPSTSSAYVESIELPPIMGPPTIKVNPFRIEYFEEMRKYWPGRDIGEVDRAVIGKVAEAIKNAREKDKSEVRLKIGMDLWDMVPLDVSYIERSIGGPQGYVQEMSVLSKVNEGNVLSLIYKLI